MNSDLQLPSRLVACSISTFVFLNVALCGFAEDPIVVHYSDPSLARMEAQLAITPAQKARFEDIVVKYRDPQSNTDTDRSTKRHLELVGMEAAGDPLKLKPKSRRKAKPELRFSEQKRKCRTKN